MSLRKAVGVLALAAAAVGLSAPGASAEPASALAGPQYCLDYIANPDPPTWLEPSARSNAISLRWTPPPFTPGQCNPEKEPQGYRITFNGQTVDVPAGNGHTVFGLSPDTSYEFKVQTIGKWDLVSEPLVINAKTLPLVCLPVILLPDPPGAVELSDADVTSTSATLRWTPAPYTPDGCNSSQEPTGYQVIYPNDGIWAGKVVNLPADATSHLVEGLKPGTAYGFKVYTRGPFDGRSDRSLDISLTTDPEGSSGAITYALTGSTTINTLTKGTLPLKGSVVGSLDRSTPTFTADLSLAPTTGRLVTGSFLPVTAKVGFVPSGKTTGTLLDLTLVTNTKVRIKVLEVKLFGAIPLAGGNNCQTKQLSDIALKSTAFDLATGGTLTGTYKISDLNGCGALNGVVSPLTAGGGNTITAKLTA